MSENLSSAAVVIGALRVKIFQIYIAKKALQWGQISHLLHTSYHLTDSIHSLCCTGIKDVT